MRKQVMQTVAFFGLVLALCFTTKLPVKAYTTGELRTENGKEYLYANGRKVINDFVFDGRYTYYAQADGTPMKDRLTYHPDGEHIIYFDQYGHEVFSNFQYCPSVGYTCYFDSNGYLYKDQITFIGDKVYYLNANGKREDTGWFQFANGVDYGYANTDGTLNTGGFSQDPWGRTVFYHWNGMVARGLITDGAYNYHMDEVDGHYLGQFNHVHNLTEATCTEGSVCLDCGLTVSGALGHAWNGNFWCDRCGEIEYKLYFNDGYPFEVSYFSYSGKLYSTVEITSISYELSASYDGKMNMKIYLDGIKTYDYKGVNNSAPVYFNYKLYNGNTVADSGMIATPSLKVGERFQDVEVYSWSLIPGDYTLELLDK